MTPLVYVVRHGETTLNASGKFRGHANVPLNPKGLEQAHAVAKKLAGVSFGHAISSDRRRALETMEIISDALSLGYDITPKLRAWDVGFLSGQDKSPENLKKLESYIAHPDKVIPEGESLNQFKARVRPVIHKAMLDAISSGTPTLVVAHSSIIHELGDMFLADHKSVLVHPGGIAVIGLSKGKPLVKAVFKAKSPGAKPDTVS